MRPGIAGLACALAMLPGCRDTDRKSFPAVIVVGVDGMDPVFLERHWDSLPNLRSLRDSGGFRRLKTTTPPQSPVAWSTFITGLDPDAHGILDFVHRNPKTLLPYSSMNRTDPPRFQLSLGEWLIPLSSSSVVSLRKGVPFWKLLADRGVPVTTMRVPTNFPPAKAGRALAGMGVPDLQGGFGTFTFYTDDPEEITRDVSGGRIHRVNVPQDGRLVLQLKGPPNALRKDQRTVTLPIVVDVDPNAHAARISLGGSVAIVQEREWSEWIPVDFPLVSHVAAVRGMVRIFAKQLSPRFELYVTPVNLDPRQPAMPISAPDDFSRDIEMETGRFFTQGIAEDTAAYRHGVFSLAEYLAQSRLVFEDERRLFRYALRHFHGGFLFSYFSVVDQDSHMLWERHEPELLNTYRAVDEAIGEARRAAPQARLIVISDHGFTGFDHSFQLNAWLREKGFLAMSGPPDGEGFKGVDWSRTKAYGIGLNGLYVNLQGRESKGSVAQRDRGAILKQIIDALLQERDPSTHARIVSTVASPKESDNSPDLIVGYSPGYRASWDTGLGATAGPVIAENRDAWIGDHCIDAAAVPGVLLSSHTIRLDDPELRDVPVAILRLFSADPLPAMQGRPIF
jgi:predicted AlkP superfamily phosphohydrolase/phosphomutase